ncbi:hypothetical protein BHYA_0013g00770 [Botrytis hyacinthi]|uniref:Uncharacterized protein n=1 Tax=Botrytis hyacinthi TaxID=278943 RepID=A0A4Z1HAB2_9HELO|nr:hypothetical protein BHYA_0013g00770 [Botrytis hyacinthi]
MPSTETIEIVRHYTSIWGLTTRVAVVDAVATASIALPLSSDICELSYSHDVANVHPRPQLFFLVLWMNVIFAVFGSQREVRSLIDDLTERPLED